MKVEYSVLSIVILSLITSSCFASGLVAAWDFEDAGSGGSTADVSGVGTAANATINNATVLYDSQRSGYVLDASSGGAIIPLVPKLELGGLSEFTIQYWHKKRNPSEQWRYIVGWGGGGPRHLNQNGGMIFACQTADSGWNPLSIWRSDYPNPQAWHHVAITYNGIDFIGYIDGSNVGSVTRGGPVNDQGSQYWSIGQQWNGTAGGSWAGDPTTDYIDDVVIWDAAASPEAIQGLYEGTYTIWTAPIGEIIVPPESGKAIIPGPHDGGKETNGWKLVWQEGPGGTFTHDIYLGTNYDDVNNADNSSGTCDGIGDFPGDLDGDCRADIDDLEVLTSGWPTTYDFTEFANLADSWLKGNPYKGNRSETQYWHSNLNVGDTYYWRIDEIGSGGKKGDVWSFDVVPKWQLDKFIVFIGWSGIGDYSGSSRTMYINSLANLGINCVMDSEAVLEDCSLAGIDVMIYRNPTVPWYAENYKDHPATWGYFQYDEPSSSEIPNVAEIHLDVHWADPEKPSYTNVQSINYGVSRSYVYNFVDTVNPEILSFDFYHWYWHTFWNGYPTLIENLQFFRQVALDNNIPLVSWVEVDADNNGGNENLHRYRYSIYLNLAYGVKGIMWFTASKLYDKNTGTVSNQGYYNDMQIVNAELTNLGPILVGLNSTAVYHTGIGSQSGDDGDYMDPIPGGHWVQIDEDGFTLGMMQNAQGADYAMVMNRDKDNSHTATVRFQTQVSQVQIFDAVAGTWSSLTINGTAGNQWVQFTPGAGYGKLLSISH